MIEKVSIDDLAVRYKVHPRTLVRGMRRGVLLATDL